MLLIFLLFPWVKALLLLRMLGLLSFSPLPTHTLALLLIFMVLVGQTILWEVILDYLAGLRPLSQPSVRPLATYPLVLV